MVFHPSHRPLEIATRFPQFHSPDDDDISPTNKKHKGTLLSSYRGGHFYWALTWRNLDAALSRQLRYNLVLLPALTVKHGTPIVRLSSTALLLIVWLAAVSVAPLAAETPPGLLTLTGESSTPPPERNWDKLGIREWELRELERFHRGDGYEGFHVAYKSLKLHMTGILTRPYIVDEETRYPLIVLNHGSERGVSERYRAVALELARRGYVVVAPTFRGRGGLEGRSQGLVEYGKGEVIDLLQLAQLARKLKYVDPTRSGIIGEGHGATATLLAMERSNVFHAAVVVSPAVFSGMVENGFAGMARLRTMSDRLFGRELPQNALIRELRAREGFRNARRITTPLLFITTDADPSYQDQRRFLSKLTEHAIDYRLIEFRGRAPDFLTAIDTGDKPLDWTMDRDRAWDRIFAFLVEKIPEPPPEEEGPEKELAGDQE